MKKYALFTCNASNYNRLITTDSNGKPFLSRESAIAYGEGISGSSVYLITMSKDMERIKI